MARRKRSKRRPRRLNPRLIKRVVFVRGTRRAPARVLHIEFVVQNEKLWTVRILSITDSVTGEDLWIDSFRQTQWWNEIMPQLGPGLDEFNVDS